MHIQINFSCFDKKIYCICGLELFLLLLMLSVVTVLVCVLMCMSLVGLLETLCEHVRHLHNTLSLDAIDLSQLPVSHKKKVRFPSCLSLT